LDDEYFCRDANIFNPGKIEEKIDEKTIHATAFSIPFCNLFRASNIIVIDVESYDVNFIVVFGYYILGESVIHQLVFHEPADPCKLAKNKFFIKLILHSNYKIAAYNISFESHLFGIPPERMIETMPIPYLKKDDLISIKPIDQSAINLTCASFDARKVAEVAFRNFSCIIKTTFLVTGYDVLKHNIKFMYMNQIINYLRGKICE
jgi:hypothetical protein